MASKTDKGLVAELNELKATVFNRDKRIKDLEVSLVLKNTELDQASHRNYLLERQIVRQEHWVILRNGLAKIWNIIIILCANLKAALIDLKLLIVAAILILGGLDVATYSGNGTYGIFWNAADSQTIALLSFGLLLLGFLAIYKWIVNQSNWQPQPSAWTWAKWVTVGIVALLAAVTIITVVALFRLEIIINFLKWYATTNS
jgi:hypothetical protein